MEHIVQKKQNLTGLNAYLSKVFFWMFGGLGLSFVAAIIVSRSSALFSAISYIILILFAVELLLVHILSRRIDKLSFATSATLFITYSIVNGVTLSVIFMSYSLASISTAFISAAMLFVIMAVFGRFTDINLSKFSGIFTVSLVAIIVLGIINIFLRNSSMELFISIFGVLLFSGLTAYDMQHLESYYYSYGEAAMNKSAIMGALRLYLDFLNLFLYLLRLFGRKR